MMRTRRCIGSGAAPQQQPVIWHRTPQLRHAAQAGIVSADCLAAAAHLRQRLISGSMIKTMTKNNRDLVDLRDLLRTNQTKQRIFAFPISILK
jgi:hypothetical protein